MRIPEQKQSPGCGDRFFGFPASSNASTWPDPTVGFAVKTLEKLVADLVPIIASLNDEFFDGPSELHNGLMGLSAGGARSVIAASRRKKDEPQDYQFREEQVKGTGFLGYHTTWDRLDPMRGGDLGILKYN